MKTVDYRGRTPIFFILQEYIYWILVIIVGVSLIPSLTYWGNYWFVTIFFGAILYYFRRDYFLIREDDSFAKLISAPPVELPELTTPTKGTMRVTIRRRQAMFKHRKFFAKPFMMDELIVWLVLSESAHKHLQRAQLFDATLFQQKLDEQTFEVIARSNQVLGKSKTDTHVPIPLSHILKDPPYYLARRSSVDVNEIEVALREGLQSLNATVLQLQGARPRTDTFEI